MKTGKQLRYISGFSKAEQKKQAIGLSAGQGQQKIGNGSVQKEPFPFCFYILLLVITEGMWYAENSSGNVTDIVSGKEKQAVLNCYAAGK